jgi:D-alanyl-D-alanine dipeptidase/kynurenine formamidase
LAIALAWLICGFPSSPAAEGPPREAGPFRTPELVQPSTILQPPIRLDVRYATAKNFTRRALYPEPRVYLQRPAAEALVRVHRALVTQGLGLLVFDGYRPWSVTKAMWDGTAPDKRAFVADPAKGSKHNRGCAVDVSLFDLKTGREVPMPSPYDEFTQRAYTTYAGGSAQARKNRDLLREAMEREGFFAFAREWWHFDYKDWRAYPILDVDFSDIVVEAAHPRPADFATARIVDLTWTFDSSTLYWPTSPSTFKLDSVSFGETPGGWFYAANTFCSPEHGGTHLDAPVHFARHGWEADHLPLERLLVPAYVIDISARTQYDPDVTLEIADVRLWEASYGRIPAESVVLLRTHWGDYYPDRKRYFGDDTPGDATRLHFPSFGKEAAELLIRERHVFALGVDTPSIDNGPSKTFEVHRVAAAANVYGLENLAHLSEVPEAGAWILVAPMKIGGGSGAPLRALAVIPAP